MNSHQGLKNYQCSQCPKKYTTNGHLNDHIKSEHDKIRNLSCTFEGCLQSFARKSVLKVHMRKHTNEKPYMCDICSKAFSESSNLKIHKMTHDEVGFAIAFIILIYRMLWDSLYAKSKIVRKHFWQSASFELTTFPKNILRWSTYWTMKIGNSSISPNKTLITA